MYMNTQLGERKTKQHNTTQTPRQLFSKEKELHLRWDSNPHLMHSRCDALPTELPRQLSWLSSKQSKAKQVTEPDKQVNPNLVSHIRTCTCHSLASRRSWGEGEECVLARLYM